MSRWRVACDACDAGGWIGPRARPARLDAWCEGCQSAHALPADAAGACTRCGTPLTTGEPRFEELLGEAQNVSAVLAAWCGDPAPLATLLPERPRFLTDLDPPPSRPGDSQPARDGLEALARGQFDRARAALADAVRLRGARGHVWRGLGVAAQRTGDLPQAEIGFARAIDADPHDSAARLDRGALRARRGDWIGAREDFMLAGARREAAWNRAALRLLEAVATTPGFPDERVVRLAREEAGEPSSYWSDHTVGRLLWILLVERSLARAGDAAASCGEERVMRAAEQALEFTTFWDAALVVHGYARLGMKREAGGAARTLVTDQLATLAGEPYARGPAASWIATPLAAARAAVAEGRPGDALAAVRGLIDRPEVQRYRVPCLQCRSGSIGVDAVEEDGAGA